MLSLIRDTVPQVKEARPENESQEVTSEEEQQLPGDSKEFNCSNGFAVFLRLIYVNPINSRARRDTRKVKAQAPVVTVIMNRFKMFRIYHINSIPLHFKRDSLCNASSLFSFSAVQYGRLDSYLVSRSLELQSGATRQAVE